MRWIEQFSKGSFGLFAGQVLEGFQPLDFYHYFPLWYDIWVSRIARVIETLDIEDKSYEEVAELLPSPSSIRAILIKMIPTYQGLVAERVSKDDHRKTADFLARMTLESCPSDPFVTCSNPCHSQAEVNDTVRSLKWYDADPAQARKFGQLVTAAGSLVHGLYNDVVTDLGWEVYGPYKVEYEGKSYSYLMRHFSNMSPSELWSNEYLGKVKEVKMYALYEGVDWEISGVGCHTIAKSGNPVQGMRTYAVLADDKDIEPGAIDEIVHDYSQKAETLYREIRTKDFEELKEMVMRQECYQLKSLFDAAEIDWQPTDEMIARVEGKELVEGMLPLGKMMETVDEYKEVFGINTFAREVLGEELKQL